MNTPYIEPECIIQHEGRSFEAAGAIVTQDFAIGYLGRDPDGTYVLTNWHGEEMSRKVHITSEWKTPRSYISPSMLQVEVWLNGAWFTGRSAGVGMAWRGKPKRGK